MQVKLFEDAQKGPGHAYIEVQGVGCQGDPSRWNFAIKSNSLKQSLSPTGWQGSDFRLNPDSVKVEGERVRLFIGPELVNHIEQLDSYLLTLYLPDGKEAAGSLTVHSISYSDLVDSDRFVQPAQPAENQALAPLANPVSGRPAPVETLQEPNQLPAPATAPPAAPIASSPPHRDGQRRSPLGLIAGGVALLLLVVGGYFFYANTKAPSASAAAAKSPLALAREHLGSGGEPGKSLELASKLMAEPAGLDAAFLLIEDAAQKGHPQAMVRLGRFYDPIDPAPTGSIQKDPAQAYEWYCNAQKTGVGESTGRLRDLRGWVEKAAASGSGEARELLSRWK